MDIWGLRQTVKRHEKNAGQNDEILSAFLKIGVKIGFFLLPVTQSIYKIMVWLNQVKNL